MECCLELYVGHFDLLFKITGSLTYFQFFEISAHYLEKEYSVKLSSSSSVHNYITLGAVMRLWMVDRDPLFKVTVAADLFSILGGIHMTSSERIMLGSSDIVYNYVYITSGASVVCRWLILIHFSRSQSPWTYFQYFGVFVGYLEK